MVIVSHAIYLKNEKTESLIAIRIHRPEKRENYWTCAYEIDWPEGQRAFESTGSDALQALVLALQMIGAEIYSSEYHREGRLRAYNSGKGYGFPLAASLRDLLVGLDKVAM